MSTLASATSALKEAARRTPRGPAAWACPSVSMKRGSPSQRPIDGGADAHARRCGGRHAVLAHRAHVLAVHAGQHADAAVGDRLAVQAEAVDGDLDIDLLQHREDGRQRDPVRDHRFDQRPQDALARAQQHIGVRPLGFVGSWSARGRSALLARCGKFFHIHLDRPCCQADRSALWEIIPQQLPHVQHQGAAQTVADKGDHGMLQAETRAAPSPWSCRHRMSAPPHRPAPATSSRS